MWNDENSNFPFKPSLNPFFSHISLHFISKKKKKNSKTSLTVLYFFTAENPGFRQQIGLPSLLLFRRIEHRGTTTLPYFSLDLLLVLGNEAGQGAGRPSPLLARQVKLRGLPATTAGPGNKTFQALLWVLKPILPSPVLGQERLRNLPPGEGKVSFAGHSCVPTIVEMPKIHW